MADNAGWHAADAGCAAFSHCSGQWHRLRPFCRTSCGTAGPRDCLGWGGATDDFFDCFRRGAHGRYQRRGAGVQQCLSFICMDQNQGQTLFQFCGGIWIGRFLPNAPKVAQGQVGHSLFRGVGAGVAASAVQITLHKAVIVQAVFQIHAAQHAAVPVIGFHYPTVSVTESQAGDRCRVQLE